MQFKVPQFLEIEDKIFGPFTFKQFAYLTGGAGLSYTLFKLLGFLLGFIPILFVAGLSVALTFYRPNGKPFIDMIEAWIKYTMQNKLYIWKRHQDKIINKTGPVHPYNNSRISRQIKNENKQEVINQSGVKLSGNKLRDLAWSLDILDLKK